MDNIARKPSPPKPEKSAVSALDARVAELKSFVEQRRATRTFGPGEFANFERTAMELGA